MRLPHPTRAVSFLALALLSTACTEPVETTYEQFNADDDVLSIEVGVDDLLDPLSIELWSNTSEVVVGAAEATPGGGPAGTLHEIIVTVSQDYKDIIDRVTVRTDSGERGEDEYDLTQDYADEGIYKLELQSVADEGEIRTDTFTVRLWDVIESADTGT